MSFEQKSAVAIVGMGCRFPGGVDSPESLWDLLQRAGDAITEVPSDRWSTDRYYSADVNVPGKTYVQRAGFLRDPVDRFDPLFFGISPREAQHMDPQQRLLLEVAWEAMEEAGLIPADLAGSRTGVYVGGFALDAMTIMMSPLARHLIDTHHAATAASMTMLAARLSYIFDFRGPSVTMDTACSSSLVALHYACQALIDGECDLALAGGVNIMLSAEYPIIMSKGHFLARDGHCKSFDAKADGYSRGEGCGLVLVKRLEDALRDGDHVHAVVRGTGVNQDGRTDGITVPSADAQEALIRHVYAKAGVPLDQVSYVEAHGTGTPIGDPLEARALGRTMGAGRAGRDPLIIGSVKANIGHLEAAAGVAGLIKAALCLRHGVVPRQIHLHEPNPAIPFAELGLALPMQALPLTALDDGPTFAGVRDGLVARGLPGESVYSLRRKDDEATRVLAMIGELYTLGFAPNWRLVSGEAPRALKLPTYKWDRVQFWSESLEGRADRLGVEGHPLLGAPVPLAAGRAWNADVNGNYVPWLRDHKVDDAIVFPGAAYVEACLALHEAAEGTEPAIIEHLDLTRALMINPDAGIALQWTFDAKTRAVTASSRAHGSDEAWQTHASAVVLASAPWASAARDVAAITARCPTAIDNASLYEALSARGLNYGPAFRCVRDLRRGQGEVLATLALDDTEARAVGKYRVHPALLDAAFQALIATCGDGDTDTTLFMPVGMRQILFHAPLGASVRAHCRLIRRTNEAIEGDIVLFDALGTVLLEVKGVRCLAVGRRDAKATIPLDRWMYEYTWEQTEPAVGFAEAARWLVFTDGGAIGASLANYLRRQGAEAVIDVVPGNTFDRLSDDRFQIRRGSLADMAVLLADPAVSGCRAIIHLWGADVALNEAAVDPTGLDIVSDAMVLVQTLTDGTTVSGPMPRLYVATRDARHIDASRPITGMNQTALVGFLRVVALEQPDLRATLVDLDAAMPAAAAGRRLGQEVLANSDEDDVALRGSHRFIHRLTRRPSDAGPREPVSITSLDRDPAYKLEITVPGSIDKVRFAEVPRAAPGEQEIEIRIRSAGLNFKDVLKVLGVLSEAALEGTHCSDTLGMEATAVVTAVGPGVTGYAVGDEIVALVAGCLASHVTVRVDQLLSLPRPSRVNAQEGATVPVTFMTAYYGLAEAARLRKGETVLIHAGAGGVGMAAIQVAKWIGATIFATAGSQEKRDLLLGLGVARVWDSRSLEFVDGVKEATNGRGVDVVLNSLSGEAMERSFEALAPLGRFVEIGKRDIIEKSRLPMAAFDRSVSFSSLDLDRLTLTRPDVIWKLFQDTWTRFESGDFVPLPLTRFPAAKAAEALRFMAQAKHVGKVIVDFDDATEVVIVPLAVKKEPIRPDASYLVTGAFGGFGIELSRVLAAKGARHLVLASRGGANTEAAGTMVADLRRAGVTIHEAKVDISDASSVTKLIADIGATMPPLAGVFHAAAVLDDALIGNLDVERLRRVFAPKAGGALLLHEATKHLPLDLFVLFSSATSLIGNPGQASYVAANTVLDALAQQRRAQGLTATAINWGAIGGVGMLAEDNTASRQLELAGVHQIPVADALTVLFRVLDLDVGVVSVMDVDWSAWMTMCPGATAIPRFAALAREATSATAGADYRSSLLAVPAAERLPLLTTAMIGLVAEALQVPADKIDRQQPLSELGIDSPQGQDADDADARRQDASSRLWTFIVAEPVQWFQDNQYGRARGREPAVRAREAVRRRADHPCRCRDRLCRRDPRHGDRRASSSRPRGDTASLQANQVPLPDWRADAH